MSASAGVVWHASVGEQVTAGQRCWSCRPTTPPASTAPWPRSRRRRRRHRRHRAAAGGRPDHRLIPAQVHQGHWLPVSSPLDPGAAISVRGLVKRYGDRNAVDGVDLDIRRGEIFALLGPNGAGKTTTVEILEGYRTRDGGQVQVLGQDPAEGGRSWRAEIGIVLQSGAGDSQLTCLELLTAQAAYYPDPRDPAEVLELVGLREGPGARPVAVRGPAPPARRRAGDRGPPRPAVPRRAHHRVRPGGPPAVLVPDPLAARAGDDDAAHHALPGRGRGARRPGRRHHRRPAGRGRRPRRAGRRRGQAPAVVSWTEDGARRSQDTPTPTALVAELAARFPGEVPDLAVARPTLEDVYLQMIGQSGERPDPAAAGPRLPGARRRRAQGVLPAAGVGGLHLMFPVILLVVFGAVLDYQIGAGVSFTQYFMAGVIAAGILGASLQNMAIGIATERSDGTLKHLAGSPMPKSAYFIARSRRSSRSPWPPSWSCCWSGCCSTASTCRRARSG